MAKTELSKFNPAAAYEWRAAFQNYKAKGGLESNELNRYAFCKPKHSTLYHSDVNGFKYFKTCELGSNQKSPAILTTDFKGMQ